ncbi:hypothetical protein A2738_01385 [Candidatus Nomurabacteria bacterium RIFCSPHIGHO2_01_FULL_42_15]|uniref:POTRA domain-containing protein n=1 Tax=Candidatus Nomurabacteria bacterium RIFCSPHIGHO2_01_FULL_42_15 TaxID=1801742 RepID=A0A1F6VG08_9BACT|nr:MAG: hypothetical protein A2738_01385 [Candidatus Nomurabacteria bacterium RIFCSPHIGHO2_01_FULL_42_15]OGI93057.1 MAG: hypothetical protein A3A99_00785 [Candidatus Nomurabacteria bacterium RIFCSPLOWO2_01_FULL_41_18]
MKRHNLNSPKLVELKKQRRKIFASKIFLCLVVFCSVFAIFAYISRLPVLNIKEIEVDDSKQADVAIMRSIVEKEIADNYVWFFPKSNVFFYPKNSIKNALMNEFKSIKEAHISIDGKRTLKISLAERVASYTWCGKMPSALRMDNEKLPCYFLDDTGFIFNKAPYFSGEVYFKFYGSTDSNTDNPLGSYFLKDNFRKFILLKQTLENLGLKPVALYKEDSGDAKVFLSGRTQPTEPEIIFKSDADFQKIAENLETALNTEPLKSNLKNKYSSLLYIDLRIGNKVYYKFR